MVVGIILFAISLLGVLGLGFFAIKRVVEVLHPIVPVNFKDFLRKNLIITIIFAVVFLGMCASIYLWAQITPTVRETLSLIFGGLLFGFLSLASLQLFILHYYGKTTPKEIDNWLFIGLCVAFPLTFVFIFLLSDAYADYLNLTKPLVNGIYFMDGFGWSRPGVYGNKSNLAFYALCILSGAMYVYFISDHKMYLKYGKHGILESTLLISLPAGIIGARLWYVVGNWERDFAHVDNPFLAALDMTQGGLTILGGAIMGILVGAAWFKFVVAKNKPYKLAVTADIVVPAILVAQAVGRWGNFFNCEVHGLAVDEAYWRWLPKIIFNNAHFSSSYSSPLVGQIYVPLFLIEGITNMLGFFVMAHLFGIKLKKYLKDGDLAFMYVCWYGLTRVLMEPLRDAEFNMGNDGYWSWTWSMIFVLAGVLLIVGNHVVRFVYGKIKNNLVKEDTIKRGFISGAAFIVLSLPLIIVGAYLMATNEFAQQLVFNEFNIGLMLLICGISVLLLAVISALDIIQGMQFKKEQGLNG